MRILTSLLAVCIPASLAACSQTSAPAEPNPQPMIELDWLTGRVIETGSLKPGRTASVAVVNANPLCYTYKISVEQQLLETDLQSIGDWIAVLTDGTQQPVVVDRDKVVEVEAEENPADAVLRLSTELAHRLKGTCKDAGSPRPNRESIAEAFQPVRATWVLLHYSFEQTPPDDPKYREVRLAYNAAHKAFSTAEGLLSEERVGKNFYVNSDAKAVSVSVTAAPRDGMDAFPAPATDEFSVHVQNFTRMFGSGGVYATFIPVREYARHNALVVRKQEDGTETTVVVSRYKATRTAPADFVAPAAQVTWVAVPNIGNSGIGLGISLGAGLRRVGGESAVEWFLPGISATFQDDFAFTVALHQGRKLQLDAPTDSVSLPDAITDADALSIVTSRGVAIGFTWKP